MTKRSSLNDALHKAADDGPKNEKSGIAAPPTKRKNSKVMIGALFDPAVRRQLKILEAETDQNLHELLSEALNDLFAKHRKDRIA